MSYPSFPIFYNKVRANIIRQNASNTQQYIDTNSDKRQAKFNFDTVNIIFCSSIVGLVLLVFILVMALLFLKRKLNYINHFHRRLNEEEGAELMVVNNSNIEEHSGEVVDLISKMFPLYIQHRNVTALRTHHKNQKMHLKSYQDDEETTYVATHPQINSKKSKQTNDSSKDIEEQLSGNVYQDCSENIQP